MIISRLFTGLVLALLISVTAYAVGALSTSVMIADIIVGILTFGIGGLTPGVLLMLFFLSSSLLSRIGGERKRQVQSAFAKGRQRDLAQVFANGGLSAMLAAVHGLSSGGPWLAGIAGALAAANSDTWATELGVLSRRQPKLITSAKPVAPGTSGAVSPLGLLASLSGAALIALAGGLLGGGLKTALGAVIGGLAGSLLDSFLGCTVQAMYYCHSCNKETERHPLHSCGDPTAHIHGWLWLDNDRVNLAATFTGAAISMAIWGLLSMI
jgi:uncharacterized protein (TIGR00297 family)